MPSQCPRLLHEFHTYGTESTTKRCFQHIPRRHHGGPGQSAREHQFPLFQGQFDLGDFLNQLKTIKKMGPLQEVLEKLPMFGGGVGAGQGEGANQGEAQPVHGFWPVTGYLA